MKNILALAGCSVGTIAVLACLWIISSYFEAQSYNRLTGKSVSTWDAMYLELRVVHTIAEDPTPMPKPLPDPHRKSKE